MSCTLTFVSTSLSAGVWTWLTANHLRRVRALTGLRSDLSCLATAREQERSAQRTARYFRLGSSWSRMRWRSVLNSPSSSCNLCAASGCTSPRSGFAIAIVRLTKACAAGRRGCSIKANVTIRTGFGHSLPRCSTSDGKIRRNGRKASSERRHSFPARLEHHR